ncbi:MAG TPA: carbamoyltransferase HypF [bacterium]|nr:carbamoyltransferase HypF [bacterium]
MNSTYQIIVRGIVQGVGFRPFIYNLAKKYGIKGYVFNSSEGVEIKVQGRKQNIIDFQSEIQDSAPSPSMITSIRRNKLSKKKPSYGEFQIKPSKSLENQHTHLPPELNVCEDCLKELFDPNDRRYFYPFINCTNCGPRFTITKKMPYDRVSTTMSKFEMCPECRSEYKAPPNRRFHAQPNSCFQCGPKLELYDNAKHVLNNSNSPQDSKKLFQKMASLLQEGEILSIKSNGGFHLACNALDDDAVNRLRDNKYRFDRAFALMFPDISTIKKYCHVSDDEEQLLISFTRPIVLLKRKAEHSVSPSVAPNNNYLGVMLPYNPIQFLLFHYFDKPLVMTSGNISGEPIIVDNDRALEKLSQIASYHCLHNRDIHMRCDDSVYRIFRQKRYPIRRSRSFVPESININYELNKPILACGAERKNTFAVAKQNDIWLSQHIGDLENLAALNSYESSIEHFLNVFSVQPEIIAHDLHPDYLSTQYANNYDGDISRIAIQHHHAHAVSCMVENEITDPTIAILLDGTGAGPDGTIWGGEILLAELSDYRRLAHFDYIKMPGGISAIHNPWEMAVSYLFSIYGSDLKKFELPFIDNDIHLELIIKMLEQEINTPLTSSCGRLFDGVAALAGIRKEINYEGQAAIELEQKITTGSNKSYQMYIDSDPKPMIIKWDEMFPQIVQDVLDNVSRETISLKFHNALASVLLKAALELRQSENINRIVLSGGVFMNMYLLDRLVNLLRNKNFEVYWHNKVPANDGGIALGQTVIADAKLRR